MAHANLKKEEKFVIKNKQNNLISFFNASDVGVGEKAVELTKEGETILTAKSGKDMQKLHL